MAVKNFHTLKTNKIVASICLSLVFNIVQLGKEKYLVGSKF